MEGICAACCTPGHGPLGYPSEGCRLLRLLSCTAGHGGRSALPGACLDDWLSISGPHCASLTVNLVSFMCFLLQAQMLLSRLSVLRGAGLLR